MASLASISQSISYAEDSMHFSVASHAWFSIFIPNFGWVDFDSTNHQIPIDQHIVVGWGRDYYDVPPLKGVVFGSGKSKLKVAVDIAAAI